MIPKQLCRCKRLFLKTYESQDYVRYDQEMEYDGEKGMSHKQIAAGYGVSLVSVDRHLARSGRKKTAKTDKAYSTVPMINSEVKNNRLLINKHEL